MNKLNLKLIMHYQLSN